MTRLALLTDLHYQARDTDHVAAHLENTVQTFDNQIAPDRVVVLGDIIHDVSPATDRKNAATIRDILYDLTTPVRYLSGNHDTTHLSPGTSGHSCSSTTHGLSTRTPHSYSSIRRPRT